VLAQRRRIKSRSVEREAVGHAKFVKLSELLTLVAVPPKLREVLKLLFGMRERAARAELLGARRQKKDAGCKGERREGD
jgi:hypothetical protein